MHHGGFSADGQHDDLSKRTKRDTWYCGPLGLKLIGVITEFWYRTTAGTSFAATPFVVSLLQQTNTPVGGGDLPGGLAAAGVAGGVFFELGP